MTNRIEATSMSEKPSFHLHPIVYLFFGTLLFLMIIIGVLSLLQSLSREDASKRTGMSYEQDPKSRSETTTPIIDLTQKYPVSSDWQKKDSAVLQSVVFTPADWSTRDDAVHAAFIIQNPAFEQERVPASVTLTTDNPHGVILTLEKLQKDGKTFDEIAAPGSDATITQRRKIRVGNDSGVLIDSYSLFEQGPYVFYAMNAWVDQGDTILHVFVSFRDQKVFQDLYEEDVLSIIGSMSESE